MSTASLPSEISTLAARKKNKVSADITSWDVRFPFQGSYRRFLGHVDSPSLVVVLEGFFHYVFINIFVELGTFCSISVFFRALQ